MYIVYKHLQSIQIAVYRAFAMSVVRCTHTRYQTHPVRLSRDPNFHPDSARRQKPEPNRLSSHVAFAPSPVLQHYPTLRVDSSRSKCTPYGGMCLQSKDMQNQSTGMDADEVDGVRTGLCRSESICSMDKGLITNNTILTVQGQHVANRHSLKI